MQEFEITWQDNDGISVVVQRGAWESVNSVLAYAKDFGVELGVGPVLSVKLITVEATYTMTGSQGTVYPEPFSQLAAALGGRDRAVTYVELGSRVSSFMEYENQANPLGRQEFLGRIFVLI